MPVVALLFVPLLFGCPALHVGAADEVRVDHMLQMKALYLNVPFFIVRAILYFAMWSLCAWLLNSWSARRIAARWRCIRRTRAASGPSAPRAAGLRHHDDVRLRSTGSCRSIRIGIRRSSG
jgi:hypothetical protein